MATYQEKLKDPRWQKKRLEILRRDEWCCQNCFDNETTLHVHHLFYENNVDPWDYDNSLLITLCEECHEEETREFKAAKHALLKEISRLFLSFNVNHRNILMR